MANLGIGSYNTICLSLVKDLSGVQQNPTQLYIAASAQRLVRPHLSNQYDRKITSFHL